MTDRQIDFLLAGADPVDPNRLDEAGLDSVATELRDAIASEALEPALPRVRRSWRRRTMTRRVVAVGLVAASCLGVAAFFGVNRVGDGSQTAWAAPLVRAAEASPRFLVGEDGWSITRADQWGGDTGIGEMLYENGSEKAQLAWIPREMRPIETFNSETGEELVPLLGLRNSPVTISVGGTGWFRAAWHEGKWTMELDTVAASPERVAEIVGSLRPVGIDEWLSAMPAEAVRPDGRAETVDAMLADVPLPPGFDISKLREAPGVVNQRYQLGAEVVLTVVCAWVGRWVEARESGDAQALGESVAAMATSHDWAILKELDAETGYGQSVWPIADAMPTNGDIPAGRPGYKIADMYRDPGSGCITR
jgi:hypothetical protein